MKKPIVRIPDPVLTKPAEPVTSFDKKLATIISDMKTTLKEKVNPKGVGLAAPQVGLPIQLFLTRPTEKDPIRIFINPTILTKDPIPKQETKDDHLEGCLSIPDIWGTVRRSPKLTLSFQDEKGVKHEETFSGFLATIIQHEIDHLHGVLFTQRVLEQNNTFYQTTRDSKGKEVLEEVVI